MATTAVCDACGEPVVANHVMVHVVTGRRTWDPFTIAERLDLHAHYDLHEGCFNIIFAPAIKAMKEER